MIKLVVFDLDNVIIDGEAIDEIGKLANVEDEIAEITEKAMQGEIDFETSIKDRVQLLEGISIEDIEKVADELPLMDGASETIARLKDEDVDVSIISGSFDIVAEKIKEKLGIDKVYTNSFTVEDGKLTGEVTGPLVSGSKLDVLKDHVENAGITLDEVVAVGDGANDISMIESAGCGIAFNAKDSVKEIADVVVEEKDLTKVLDEILNQLTTDDAEEETVEEVEDEASEEAEAVEEVAEAEAEVEEDEAEEAADEEEAEEEASEEEAEEEAAEEEAEPEDEEAVDMFLYQKAYEMTKDEAVKERLDKILNPEVEEEEEESLDPDMMDDEDIDIDKLNLDEILGKNKDDDEGETEEETEEDEEFEDEEENDIEDEEENDEDEAIEEEKPKRRAGRPRKEDKPKGKRPVGRPKKK